MPKITNKIWSVREDEYMVKNYPNMKTFDICEKLSRTKDSVISRASILNVRKFFRPSKLIYDLNEEYFEKIDNSRKAYWYGFLWADGSMYNKSFELTLNEKDKHLIEQFKNDIESSHPIKKHSKYNTFRFLINSKRFSYHLNNLNIINRKSYSPLLPIIEDKYFFNFLMGLFDGDGCFSSGRYQIVTTENVAIWLKKKLFDILHIDSKIYNIKNSVAKRFSIQNRKDVSIIMDKLYNENCFFLERKYFKYKEFKTGLKSLDRDDQK